MAAEKTVEQRLAELENSVKRKKNGQRGKSLNGFTVWAFNLYREDMNAQKLLDLLKENGLKGLIAKHFNCEDGDKDHYHITLWFDTTIGMTKQNLSKQMGKGKYWKIPVLGDDGNPILDDDGKPKTIYTSLEQDNNDYECKPIVPVERVQNIQNLPDWLQYLTHDSISAKLEGKQHYNVDVISQLDGNPNIPLYWENLAFHDKSRCNIMGKIKQAVDNSDNGAELFEKIVTSDIEIFNQFKNNYNIIRDLLMYNDYNYKKYKPHQRKEAKNGF